MGTKIEITRKSHRPPQEYVVIVGGPSNMFNGFFHAVDEDNDAPEEAPKSTAKAEIKKYIYGPGGVRKLDNAPDRTVTHDLYWANFLYTAVKLFETRQVQPQPGDIATIVVYLPPYLLRQATDWAASPYNPRHFAKAWVNNKFPYDSSYRISEQGTGAPAVRVPAHSTAPPIPSMREDDIDFEIFMNTVAEVDVHGVDLFDGGFYRRPQSPVAYLEHIQDVPYRLIGHDSTPVRYGPPLRNVLVKLLLLRNEQDLLDYLAMGTWAGAPWTRNDRLSDTRTHVAASTYYRRTPPEEWRATPSVDRTKVKIKRIDYIGHSGYIEAGTPTEDNAFFLQYGWYNTKGELPQPEVVISSVTLEKTLSPALFTKDASAKFWGCRLGDLMAPRLSKLFPNRIEATKALVDFSFVLESPTALPAPSNSSHKFNKYPPDP
ncbi:hypothetical protein [Sorangium sp. So ce124]|uniref:hypothetical protein n=1 Tax=Sorangium sp. So ce124 TaxID=3133280 RepID=UPI003F644CF5